MTSSIAIIPARGQSKRIKNKNLSEINGIPLIAHTIKHAVQSKGISEIYVSTDCEEIARVSDKYGAQVIHRPKEISDDLSSSESALLHALDYRKSNGLKDPEYVVFLQCTSPIRKPNDIDNAIKNIIDSGANSLLSVCDNKRFIWKNENENGASINYDYMDRKREQDMEKQYQENGSIYIVQTSHLRETNNRLGGKISFYEMDYWSSFQIDEPEDFELIAWIMSRKTTSLADNYFPKKISLIVMDFDGVMTDDTAIVSQDGIESVRVHRGDGMGIERLKEAGYKMLVLSKEKNKVVQVRCEKLGITHEQGISNKLGYLKNYLENNKINCDDVIYVGNDINDLECMKFVGCPVAVSNSHINILEISKLVLNRSGGNGAIRELSDSILRR